LASATLLFDVDTGIDDALALLFALGRPDVEIAGIGVVAGNVPVEVGTENTLRVLHLKDRPDVPVARGCDRPLVQPLRNATEVHGDDGLGNTGLPPSGWSPTGEHAVDQLVRLARSRPGEITLVAVGPLTNVAVALLKEPALPRLLKNVVVMGGAFAEPGNVTATAEFNIWVDPEAARRVFEAGFDLTAVPLDATMRAFLTETHLDSLGAGPVPAFVRAVARSYLEVYYRHGRPGAAMHDPLAAAIAVDPTLIQEGAKLAVTVETRGDWTRGMTIGDRRPGERANAPPGRATICFAADVPRFFDQFLRALR